VATTWINRGHFFAPHKQPVLVDCHFQVSPSDSAGLGIVSGSLQGQGVANVFMHTTATPGKGSNGQLNPNPQSGIIYVQLTDNFYKMYQIMHSLRGPLSGTNIAVDATNLTPGNAYVISSLGTSTSADWLALGVPPGVTPAVNVSFIAKVSGAGSGTGQVQTQSSSGIDHIEDVGSPSLALNPVPVGGSPNVGGWIMLECLDAGALTAPTSGSTIRLSFYMSQSSVVVAGE
jgi:hypothetical protein